MSWSAVKLLHVTSMFFRMTQALLAAPACQLKIPLSPAGCNKTICMQAVQLRHQTTSKIK